MNRKTWLWLKLALLVLLFILLCAGAAWMANGSPSRVWGGLFGWRSAPSATQGKPQAFGHVDKILVDSVSLPIHIYEGDVAQVTVRDNSKTFGFMAGQHNTITQENGTLAFRQGRKMISIFSFSEGSVEIEIPRGAVLEYQLSNVSASTTLDAQSKNQLEAESVSGSIRILKGGDKVFAKSTSGSVKVYAPFQEATARSVSGSIALFANKDSKQISCSTVSGSVKVQLDHVPGYVVDHSTTSGSVKDTYADRSYPKSGTNTYGNPSLNIKAATVSGSIKLVDWK